VDSLIMAANKFADSGGALITVTHNRDYLKRTSNKFLSITPGSFLEYDSVKDAERATYSLLHRGPRARRRGKTTRRTTHTH
jgi:ABC-type polysaccharide/polyol phosphate transport system ATPase subunit